MDALIRERIIEYQNYIEERVIPIEYDFACSECFFLSIAKNIYCDCDKCRLSVPGSLSCYGVFERILR